MLFTGAWYLFLISLSSLLPAVLGSEFGFRRLYIKLLVDLFDWATGKGLAISPGEFHFRWLTIAGRDSMFSAFLSVRPPADTDYVISIALVQKKSENIKKM